MHHRAVLQDFVRECAGLKSTGIFSMHDGLSLDFVPGPYGLRHDIDALSAFFREVAACGQQTARGLFEGDDFLELQLAMSDDLVLMRRIGRTDFVHIAVISKDVRMGIAIVLMRRTSQRLMNCFGA
jgi:predicted regulator of Ras-like GTPase activity (Roadblock/LC7/MglB family)